jgi:hypothetical protein
MEDEPGREIDLPERASGRAKIDGLVVMAWGATLLGTALRIVGVDRKALWADEVATFWRAGKPTLSALVRDLESSPFPPLYYILLWYWARIWGVGDLAIRALPVCLGVLTVPATYLVWRGLIGRRASLWAASMLSLNAYHIGYSQDAKMYAAVWLLATLSSGAFLHAVGGGPKRIPWLFVYGLSSAGLPLISYVGLATLVVHALYGAILWVRGDPLIRLRILDVATVGLAALIPLALWSPMMIRAVTRRSGIGWIPPAHPSQIPTDLMNVLSVFLFGYRTTEREPVGVWSTAFAEAQITLVGAATCLLILGLMRARRRVSATPFGAATFLAFWFLVPLAGALAFSLAVYSLWGVPRFLSAVAPALILMAGVGLASIRGPRLAAGCGLAFLLANLAMIVFDRTHPTRVPWREIARQVEAVAGPIRARSPAAPAAPSIVVSWSGWSEGDLVCLKHAMGLYNPVRPPVRSSFREPAAAVQGEEAFAMVAKFEMATDAAARARSITSKAGGRICRLLWTADIYEEYFSSLPSLDPTFAAEVWLCGPLGAAPGSAASLDPAANHAGGGR